MPNGRNMKKIGFIGTGNMGSALARCVYAAGGYELYFADKDEKKASLLANELSGKAVSTAELVTVCDCIFLGVKPNLIGTVLEDNRPIIRERRPLLVSMAAGVSVASLEGFIGSEIPIIRIMPNTPCSIGSGVILVSPNGLAIGEYADKFVSMMSRAGIVDQLDEKYIDAASALSGCGPAFVYMFTEALADGAVASGLPRDKATLYAASTVIGAAKMILETGKHPEQLKDEVCSPGGSTIEGVRALDEGAMRGTVSGAVVASYEKTLRLGK